MGFRKVFRWVFVAPLLGLAACSSGPSIGQTKQALVHQPPGNIVPETDANGADILDPNGIVLNPMWGIQYNQLHGLGGDGGATLPPRIMDICAFDVDSDGQPRSVTQCMTQGLETNMLYSPFTPLCPDALTIGLFGHLNWKPLIPPSNPSSPEAITVQGPIEFDEKEGDTFGDGDYNVKIKAHNEGDPDFLLDRRLLLTHPADNGDTNAFSPHLKIEFQSGETAYRYRSPRWTAFKQYVTLRGLLDGDPAGFLTSGFGIVTGLFGVDGVHNLPLTNEIHPAWAFSTYVDALSRWTVAPTNPSAVPECAGTGTGRFQQIPCGVDRWATFVRSRGNEGTCGPNVEGMTFNDNRDNFKIRYPWFGPKGVHARVTAIPVFNFGSDFELGPLVHDGGFGGFIPHEDHDIEATFAFDPVGLSVAGDLTFVYGSARLFGISRMFSFDGGFVEGTVDDRPKQWFFAEDFTGDGIVDMAHAFDDDQGQLSVEVYPNNGNGTLGPMQRWGEHMGGLDGAGVEKNSIVAADFNADGAADIGHAYLSADGKIAFEVLLQLPQVQNGSRFERADWTPDGGGWAFLRQDRDDYQFVVGDFTGDRRPDLAYVFLDDRSDTDKVSIYVYENSATAKGGTSPGLRAPVVWVDRGGDWESPHLFIAGEFTGDTRTDIAYVFEDDETDPNSHSIDIYQSSPTANNGNGGFESHRYAARHGVWQDIQAFVAADFTSDGRTDIGYAFNDSTLIENSISLDVEESSATAMNNGTDPGFLPNARWSDSLGLWATSNWVAGDFDNDCAPDMANVFKTDATISADNHRNLFVPNRTVDFSYVPPDMVVSTCVNPNIGQARAKNCNPHPGDPPPPPLNVTKNAPSVFPIGQTSVVWTVTDPTQPNVHKDVIQRVTVLPGDDPQCQLNKSLAVGPQSHHSCTIQNDGSLKCWGENSAGQLGITTTQSFLGSVPQDGPFPLVPVGQPVTSVALGGQHTCALLADGSVKCWGYNGSGQLGQESTANIISPTNSTPVYLGDTATAIAVGGDTSCALLSSGQMKCWGMGAQGQLGKNSTVSIGRGANDMHNLTPIDVGGLVKGITAGSLHVCARLESGSVKCWGYNGNGQLGVENWTNQKTPQLVLLPLGDVAQSVVAGGYHTCVLLTTGAVKCFGRNGYGQLGIGLTTQQGCCANTMGTNLNPVILNGAVPLALAAGIEHTCALLQGGTVRCWGLDGFGQDGRPGITNSGIGDAPNEMEQLGSISLSSTQTVKAITAGWYTGCALLTDGHEKCWGYNSHGNLGIGDHVHRGWDLTKMGDALPFVMLQ